MKNVIASSALIFLFAVASYSQAPCTRHVETAGGFSYCPPAGWTQRDSQTSPYKSFFTPPNSSFKANFNVRDEKTTASHEVYMAAALQLLLDGNEAKGAEARKVIGWSKFRTNSNLTGSRMVYEMIYQGYAMRTIQVILDLPGRKLLITGTALVENKNTTDAIFDEAAKTIALNAP